MDIKRTLRPRRWSVGPTPREGEDRSVAALPPLPAPRNNPRSAATESERQAVVNEAAPLAPASPSDTVLLSEIIPYENAGAAAPVLAAVLTGGAASTAGPVLSGGAAANLTSGGAVAVLETGVAAAALDSGNGAPALDGAREPAAAAPVDPVANRTTAEAAMRLAISAGNDTAALTSEVSDAERFNRKLSAQSVRMQMLVDAQTAEIRAAVDAAAARFKAELASREAQLAAVTTRVVACRHRWRRRLCVYPRSRAVFDLRSMLPIITTPLL